MIYDIYKKIKTKKNSLIEGSSPISSLLFVIYVSSLHIDLPKGVTLSYVDDFSWTAVSLSYRMNIRILQKAFKAIRASARARDVDFGVPKTELIHWRTPKQWNPPGSSHPSPIRQGAWLLAGR